MYCETVILLKMACRAFVLLTFVFLSHFPLVNSQEPLYDAMGRQFASNDVGNILFSVYRSLLITPGTQLFQEIPTGPTHWRSSDVAESECVKDFYSIVTSTNFTKLQCKYIIYHNFRHIRCRDTSWDLVSNFPTPEAIP